MDFGQVVPIGDFTGGAVAVVEVVVVVEPRVVILVMLGSGPAIRGTSRHVVDHGVDDDGHTGFATGVDHIGEFGSRAEFRLDFVAGRLVVDPPLSADDVLLRRAHFDPVVAGWPKVGGAFLGQRVPGPLEHLNANALFGNHLGWVARRSHPGWQQGRNGGKGQGPNKK